MISSSLKSRRGARRTFAPTLERLEDRTVPSGLQSAFDPGTATWYVRSSNTPGAPDAGQFQYGGPGWLPVVGDWNGDGRTTIGVVDPSTNTWYLRNSNSAGAPDITPFAYGAPGWLPVAGQWSGPGPSGIGVFDPNS